MALRLRPTVHRHLVHLGRSCFDRQHYCLREEYGGAAQQSVCTSTGFQSKQGKQAVHMDGCYLNRPEEQPQKRAPGGLDGPALSQSIASLRLHWSHMRTIASLSCHVAQREKIFWILFTPDCKWILVVYCCGSDTLTAERVLAMSQLLFRFFKSSRPNDVKGLRISLYLRARDRLNKSKAEALSTKLGDLSRLLCDGSRRLGCLTLATGLRQRHSLLAMLSSLTAFNCADTRDKIYGVLAIVD
jgi:hypothetical protein